MKLQFGLGAVGIQNDMDLRPNYTLNWLPAAGQSAIIKVRLMCILKGNDTRSWSDSQQWTLTRGGTLALRPGMKEQTRNTHHTAP